MSKPEPLRHFFSKVVGVTFQNDDGTERQSVICQCYLLEQLVLDHQENNPHDPFAVRICRASGEQLGFLRAELAEEVVRLDQRGYRWCVYIAGLTGGTADAPTRGANLLIVRVAPGVSKADATAYIEKLADEIESRPVGAPHGYGTNDDDGDGMIVQLDLHRARGKSKGCGAGLLLVAVALALAMLGARFLMRSHDSRRPATRLDDLTGNPVALLGALPNVHPVTRSGTGRPTKRIVHLLNWHLIPPDLHRIDAGKHGQTYAAHLDDVDTVHVEMVAVLRALVTDHGVKQALVEGLTPTGLEAWQARLEGLGEMLATVPNLRRALADAEHFRKSELVKQARELLEQGRRERLELGAVGVLASEGLLEALPLDDDATLDATDPRRPGGTDARKERARDAAIVRRALAAASPVAIIVLGGGHDLSREIALQGGGQAEYVRLAMRAYQCVAGR